MIPARGRVVKETVKLGGHGRIVAYATLGMRHMLHLCPKSLSNMIKLFTAIGIGTVLVVAFVLSQVSF